MIVEHGERGQILLLQPDTAHGLLWSRRSPLFQATAADFRPHQALRAVQPDTEPVPLESEQHSRPFSSPPLPRRVAPPWRDPQLPTLAWWALLALAAGTVGCTAVALAVG